MSSSVYIAGQVLKKLLAEFPNKVDGQQAVAEKKANLIYQTLDAYPEVYRVVPDKSVRSRMNVCFRVTKVCLPQKRSCTRNALTRAGWQRRRVGEVFLEGRC